MKPEVEAEAIAVVPETLPRPRGRALLLAAGTLWLPCLLPMATGMLRECGHCAQTFVLFVPVMPGAIIGVLLRTDDLTFVLASAVPTLAAFLGLYLAAREMPRKLLYAVQTLVIVLVALEAIGFANAVRM